MGKSKIDWTEYILNPFAGCKPVSEGCDNCCALPVAWRHSHNPKLKHRYEGVVEKVNGKLTKMPEFDGVIHGAMPEVGG